MKNTFREIKSILILRLTQSLSSLGSAMTNFALVIWLYNESGSALTTALLTICSYAPYVLMSIFAGALSDKWNKKTVMLVCDSFAALCSIAVFTLMKTGRLEVWHLYCLNALNGLMNTIQQPASEVASTLLTPKKYYQKLSGFDSFSNSLVTILTPAIATSVMAFAGVETVILIDLFTFALAFCVLLFFIKIPRSKKTQEKKESVLSSAKSGLIYLRRNKGILWLILFLAAINLIASMYNAALPAMLLSRKNGGETVLGAVNTCTGLATLAGSLIATLAPAPKSRVRVICACLLVSMSTENFLLAFGRTPVIWCLGAVMGWLLIPLMSANMSVIFRERIPLEMQGRVYSARNTLQFFTIPVGYLLGGALIDGVFEPLMASLPQTGMLPAVFGCGKGSGAALLFAVLGFAGTTVCLIFSRVRHIHTLDIR